jgi:hypothetical protein
MVQDRDGPARLCTHRRTLHSAGAGTTEGAMKLVPTSTRGDASLGSPPPDLNQAKTALPSSPSLLSTEEAETLDPAVNVAGKEELGGSPERVVVVYKRSRVVIWPPALVVRLLCPLLRHCRIPTRMQSCVLRRLVRRHPKRPPPPFETLLRMVSTRCLVTWRIAPPMTPVFG